MKDLRVWLRIGDQDDYRSFDSVDDAASTMREYLGCTINDEMVIRRYVGHMLIGIEIPDAGYVQENGISLFWGDDDAQFEASLSDWELEVFIRTLHVG